MGTRHNCLTCSVCMSYMFRDLHRYIVLLLHIRIYSMKCVVPHVSPMQMSIWPHLSNTRYVQLKVRLVTYIDDI